VRSLQPQKISDILAVVRHIKEPFKELSGFATFTPVAQSDSSPAQVLAFSGSPVSISAEIPPNVVAVVAIAADSSASSICTRRSPSQLYASGYSPPE